MRYTPAHIAKLNDNQIFVFGANKNGFHGSGAAAHAMKYFGAIWGQGNGIQGKSYGIDTMSGIDEMKKQIDNFINFAKLHPELEFLVTKVGCGIAGYSVSEVSELFVNAINLGNVVLPEDFIT